MGRRVRLRDGRLRALCGRRRTRTVGARPGRRRRRHRRPGISRREDDPNRPRQARTVRRHRCDRRARAARHLPCRRLRPRSHCGPDPDRALAQRIGCDCCGRRYLRCDRPTGRRCVRCGSRNPLRRRRRVDEGDGRRQRPSGCRAGGNRLLRGRHDRAADGLPAGAAADHRRHRHVGNERDPDRGRDDAVRGAAAGRSARRSPGRGVRGRRRRRRRTRAATHRKWGLDPIAQNQAASKSGGRHESKLDRTQATA
jgi:hypothetical protein